MAQRDGDDKPSGEPDRQPDAEGEQRESEPGRERRPDFTSVFIAEVEQPTAELVKATGKCAQCHRRETGSIVREYEMSAPIFAPLLFPNLAVLALIGLHGLWVNRHEWDSEPTLSEARG